MPSSTCAFDQLPSIQATIRAHNLAARKPLGQHFLLDPTILSRIVAAAGPLDGQPVLEVGPGPGGLSREILRRGANLVAIEQDQRCIEALRELKNAAGSQLQLVSGDALKNPWPVPLTGQRDVSIIANLPYNISALLLAAWLKHLPNIRQMILMFQKEVAGRIVAAHGTAAYGRLSVAAQSHCSIEKLFDLPPGAFHPAPKVHSTVLKFTGKPDRPEPVLAKAITQVTAAAFNQRRKMLRSSLKALDVEAAALCSEAGIELTERAERLSLVDYRRLGHALLNLRRGTV